MPGTQSFIQNLRDQIAHNQIAEVLQSLRTLLDNSPLLDEAILQAARFQDIRQQIRLGVVSHEDASLTENQIRAGLLDLLREIEALAGSNGVTSSNPVTTAIRAEMERAVSVVGSKNVVVGSTISAGGNVHIGDKTIVQNADKIYNIGNIDTANFL